LILLGCAGFGLALVCPMFTLHPSAGQWDPVLRIFVGGAMKDSSVVLPQAVGLLWEEQQRMLALLVGGFSIVLPVVKLSVLWARLVLGDALPGAVVKGVELVARFSMLDVFVLALLVVAVKGLPGGSRIELGVGAAAFAISVFAGMAAAWLAGRRSPAGGVEAVVANGRGRLPLDHV